MAAVPHVFLCFELERHDQDRIDFIEARSACPTPFDVEDWSQPDRAPRGDWDSYVLDQIDRSDLTIILVGPNTAGDRRVEREIGFTKRRNVPYFGVYVGGALPGRLCPQACPPTAPWPSIGHASGRRSASSCTKASITSFASEKTAAQRVRLRRWMRMSRRS